MIFQIAGHALNPPIVLLSRPEVVFVDQPFSWVPTAISLFQFVALLAFAIYTFRTGAQQKLRERQAAWFHKVVVDPLIARIDDFFSKSTEKLHAAADVVDRDRLSGATTLSPAAKRQITDFKNIAFALGAEVSRRLLPFDAATERWASQLFDNLEEDVTQWFDSQLLIKPHDKRDALDSIVVDFYTTLLKGLIRMEFRQWG